MLSQFAKQPARARERYRAFITEGLGHDPWGGLRGAIYLGSEEFARELTEPNETIAEVPRAQWDPVRRPLADLFREHGATALERAYREEGYPMCEIADYLAVHYATVSRRLRRLEEQRIP